MEPATKVKMSSLYGQVGDQSFDRGSPLTSLKEWERRIAAGDSPEDIIREKYRGVAFVPKRSRLAQAIDPRAQRMHDARQFHMGD